MLQKLVIFEKIGYPAIVGDLLNTPKNVKILNNYLYNKLRYHESLQSTQTFTILTFIHMSLKSVIKINQRIQIRGPPSILANTYTFT